ncbi:secondary thiamine-phosphate synthase enzyme YjbQ [Nitratifractor sp.]
MTRIELKSNYKTEMIDITETVTEQVMKLGIRDGLCTVFTPHTTASVVLFEKTDPKLRRDFLSSLSRIAPADMNYESEGDNTPAHIKSTLCGPRIVVPVKDGQLLLGEWQGIFFCEFDGPREEREYIVQVIQ